VRRNKSADASRRSSSLRMPFGRNPQSSQAEAASTVGDSMRPSEKISEGSHVRNRLHLLYVGTAPSAPPVTVSNRERSATDYSIIAAGYRGHVLCHGDCTCTTGPDFAASPCRTTR
jgi:hypothetical protein